MDVASDYLLIGMVKPDDGKIYTHVLSVTDGTYIGSLAPGPEVGANAGWQDMPYSIQALAERWRVSRPRRGRLAGQELAVPLATEPAPNGR